MMSPLCPRHDVALAGGPVQFTCPEGHGVYAADLDNEFVPRTPVIGDSPLVKAAYVWALATSILTYVVTVVAR